MAVGKVRLISVYTLMRLTRTEIMSMSRYITSLAVKRYQVRYISAKDWILLKIATRCNSNEHITNSLTIECQALQ